jgi:hypothetical protein
MPESNPIPFPMIGLNGSLVICKTPRV